MERIKEEIRGNQIFYICGNGEGFVCPKCGTLNVPGASLFGKGWYHSCDCDFTTEEREAFPKGFEDYTIEVYEIDFGGPGEYLYGSTKLKTLEKAEEELEKLKKIPPEKLYKWHE